MEKELIKKINSNCPSDQGIFQEGFMIPNNIKELCVYTKYSTGGMKGGTCWGDRPEYINIEPPKNRYKVLDIILQELKPNISYLEYKGIDELWQYRDDTFDDYYGNNDNVKVEFIILSDLEIYLNSLDNEKQ